MAISRERKEELVEEYRELLERSAGIIISSHSGLTVNAAEELRAKIREVGGEFHIVKNSLMKLAMEEANVPIPDGSLDGTTAVGFADDDIPGVAKAIVDLAKDAEVVHIKAGIVRGAVYNDQQIARLAELPPLDVLRAQLMGLLEAPAGQLAGVLQGSVRQVVNVVKAYSETEEAGAAAA